MAITNSDFALANRFLIIDDKIDEVAKMRAQINSDMKVVAQPVDSNLSAGDYFMEQIDEARAREQNVTIIWTEHMPSSLKEVRTFLVQTIEIINDDPDSINIAVYEIGNESNQIFTSGTSKSLVLPDIDELILESKDRKSASMIDNVDVNEESKLIIDELSKDNREKTHALKEAQKLKEEALNSQADLKAEIQLHKDQLEKMQKELEIAQKLKEEAENNYENRSDEIESLHRNIDKLNAELSDLKIKYDEANIKIDKFKEENQSYISMMNAKDIQINDLTQELSEERTKTMGMEQDADEMSTKVQQAKRDMEQIASLRDELAKMRGENTKMKIQLDSNKELINNLRSTSKNTTDAVLPQIEFNHIKLMYFRVLNDLPYFHWYIKQMRKLLFDLTMRRKKVKIIDIRRDHELDAQFLNINKIANIGNALENENYLIPNSNMADGKITFENNCDILIVLDYTGRRNPIIKTTSIFDEYVVLTDGKDAKKIEAPGGIISNGDDSLLDLSYNEDFIRYPESVERLTEDVLGAFLSTSKVMRSETD